MSSDYTKSLFLLVQSEMKSVLQGLDMAKSWYKLFIWLK